MNKRALLRLATSICFMLCVLFLRQITVFADEVKPVHEYNFDNDSGTTVLDSANENTIDGIANGTNSGAFVTGYNEIGNARQFNGTDDYISFSDSVIPIGAKSIRFKIRKDASTVANTDRWESILSTEDAKRTNGLYIGIGPKYKQYVQGGVFILLVNASSDILMIQTPTSVCDGQWHDILFSWDGTTDTNSVKLYLDDMKTPVAQATPTSTEGDNRNNLSIGSCDYTGPLKNVVKFNGNLDNIQIYNSVISPNLSNLTASGGTSKIDLTWDAVDKATSYTIKRSATAGGPYTTVATDITETSYTDTDVTSGTTYYYIVTAVNTGTEITDSNEASAEPTADQTTPTTEAKLKVVLEVAESLRLSVDDDLSVNTQMSWSSSDPTVATVNEKGIVTALATGNTVITVKSIDGSYTDYINVLVVENADDYRLAIDLKVGETARLTADDYTNTANITWAPMDSSIANVTTKGKVTALSKGLVLITAKDADGNIIGRVYVRVREY